MTSTDNNARINRLEILFSEQEHTIETLNSVITRQDQDILQLNLQLNHLKQQIQELKQQLPPATLVDEKPPHY